jgi:hypothetical protein
LLSDDVEKVFDRHWQPGNWREHVAGFAQCVLGIGCRSGTVGVDVEECARPLPFWVSDRGQRLLDQLAARGSSPCELAGKCKNGRRLDHAQLPSSPSPPHDVAKSQPRQPRRH